MSLKEEFPEGGEAQVGTRLTAFALLMATELPYLKMLSEADGQRAGEGFGVLVLFLQDSFILTIYPAKKVNKNKVQNKRREKILLAALKSFPNACFWQGREIWYLAT